MQLDDVMSGLLTGWAGQAAGEVAVACPTNPVEVRGIGAYSRVSLPASDAQSGSLPDVAEGDSSSRHPVA